MSENSSSDESRSRRSEASRAGMTPKESAESAAARRLKRVAPSQKNSKLARLSRARRANTGPVKHPRDLLGVSLANGRYIVKSPLGKGSMAYVFRASDARLQTDVVLKVPKPEKINTADFRERFHRESQMLIRFSHPHVVKVLDVGEYAELPYVVMQLLEGGSLSDRIAREADEDGCMTPESLKSWVREVARALDFCYRKGMVHRDVKPANILFDEDKNAYVGDFGLSKIMGGEHTEMSSDETAAGVVLGTPNYISPEVVQGKDYDGRSDQYSLGITIYHVLTGGPPMQGNTATMTMLNQTQKVLPLLSDVREEIPRPLAVAVRKAIDKEPDRRFNTCEEFAEAVIEGLRFAPLISTSSSSSTLKPSSSSSRRLRSELASEGNKAKPAGKLSAKTSTESALASGAERKGRKPQRSESAGKPKATRRQTARRGSAAGGNSSSRRTTQTASSGSSLEADLDWFDMDRSGDYLPGRSSSSSRSSSKKSSRRAKQTKSTGTKLVNVFGQQLHPAVLVGLAISVTFSFVIFVWSPWAPDEFAPDLVAGQYHPASQISPTTNQQEMVSRNFDRQSSDKQLEDTNTDSAPTTVASTGQRDPQLPDTALPAFTVVSDYPQPLDGVNSADSSVSPVAEFLSSQDSSPLFGSPIGMLARFGDGACDVFVSGRSVRSRKTGEQVAVLSGEYESEGLATLSQDGNWFAATLTTRRDRKYRVRVWNTKTGEIDLEVRGDGRRSLRNLFLSDQYLYLETDKAERLEVWNLTSQRQQGVLTLPADRLRSQRMGMTRDGTAFAALVGDRLSIIHGVSGVVTTQLDSPLPQPVQVAMANSSSPLGRVNSTKMLQSLEGIQFSHDQLHLAAIRTVPESALMTWNELGHLQFDLPFAVSAVDCQPDTVQWFKERSAWLVNGSVIDAKHRRVVVAVPHGDDQKAMVVLQDDDHLMTTSGVDVANVYRRQIPWEFIDDSLSAMSEDETALLEPGGEVGLSVKIGDGNGTGIVLRTLLENAIQQRLAGEEIKVDDTARLEFQVTSRRGLEEHSGSTVLELIDTQTNRLVWYGLLGKSFQVDSGDFNSQRLYAETLAQRISSLAIPYYVPSDSSRLMLPYFINE